MPQLIDFYRGTGSDTRGRSLEQIWSYSDKEMEYHHDFIQWLFPLREPSQYNPHAPVLCDEDIQIFRANDLLRQNLKHSFEHSCPFWAWPAWLRELAQGLISSARAAFSPAPITTGCASPGF